MTKRTVLAVGAAAVLVAAAAAAAFLLRAHGASHPAAGRIPAAASSTAPAGQAQQVAAALSKLAADPQSLVATGARDEVGSRSGQAIPAGSRVSSDVTSWAPDGIGGGTMIVTVTPPGKPPARYAAVMVTEHGAWKVLATFPLDAAPDATATPS